MVITKTLELASFVATFLEALKNGRIGIDHPTINSDLTVKAEKPPSQHLKRTLSSIPGWRAAENRLICGHKNGKISASMGKIEGIWIWGLLVGCA